MIEEATEEDAERRALVRASVALESLAKELRGNRSGKDMILETLMAAFPDPVPGSVLRTVSGIQEFGRRIRELRVEDGYDVVYDGDSYRLRSFHPDPSVADRWKKLNHARRRTGSATSRLQHLFLEHVGEVFDSDELFYVAKTSEWARRVRELRSEEGLRIETHHDNPDLRPAEYVLVDADPIPVAERDVPAQRRRLVLERDDHRCVLCGRGPDSSHRLWLEVDHVVPLSSGGSNDVDNLRTLCNACHQAR